MSRGSSLPLLVKILSVICPTVGVASKTLFFKIYGLCGLMFKYLGVSCSRQNLESNSLKLGVAYLYSLKTSENLKVFQCFQGVKFSKTGL